MSIYQGWKHLPSDLHRADAENGVRPRPASQPASEYERLQAEDVAAVAVPQEAHALARTLVGGADADVVERAEAELVDGEPSDPFFS